VHIDRVEIRHLKVPLKASFETSFGRMYEKDCLLVAVSGEGQTGYGESVAFAQPWYSEETTGTIHHVLSEFLIPRLLGKDLQHPDEVSTLLASIRGNRMAIASLEGAVWDWFGKLQGRSLAGLLGGTREQISVGVSIGIEPTIDEVLRNVGRFLDEGYRKIKVKIKPGYELPLIRAIRDRFGMDFPLMADANSAYTLADTAIFQQLDAFNLLMIEQPLAHDDIVDHAKLQQQIRTPICLDESIHKLADARLAIEHGACRIINIKIGRVGGFTEARRIHDLCLAHNLPVWCGGMLELGVGRAHNIAIASLPGFTIAGDTAASARTYAEDIVEPAIDFCSPGHLAVPSSPGLGYHVVPEKVEKFTVARAVFGAR